jgi:hypothetical protein
MRFAYSVAAYREGRETTYFRHGVGVCEAVDRDHALGQALAIARKIYPARHGFRDHDAMVCPVDQMSSPSDVAVLESNDME